MRFKFLSLALLVSFSQVQAASFNCSGVTSQLERAICDDAELNELDSTLGRLYTYALNKSSDKNAMKNVQDSWWEKLRSISHTGKSDAIYKQEITHLYAEQIDFLASDCIQEVHRWGANCVCDKETNPDWKICGEPLAKNTETITVDGMTCDVSIRGNRRAVYLCEDGNKKVLYGTGGACATTWEIYSKTTSGYSLTKVLETAQSGNPPVCAMQIKIPPSRD